MSYKNIYFLFLIFLISSCSREGFLDIQPRGEIIPDEIADFRAIMDNFPLLTYMHGSNHLITDEVNLFGDSFDLPPTSEQNRYLFRDNIFNINENDFDWDMYYEVIFNCNVVLDGLTEFINGQNNQIAAQIAAEARIHRAFAYFMLVNLYGLHFNPDSADSDLGVPLRLTIDFENVQLPRASVAEVYDFVIAEINTAIPSLPDTVEPEFLFRPSKIAAYGMLSRIYLYQGNYTEAVNAVDQALAFGGDLRNLNNDRILSDGSTDLPNLTEDPETFWLKGLDFGFTPSYSVTYLDLYEENDLRRTWFTATPREVLFTSTSLDSNFRNTTINVPDLLLTRMEALTRLGQINEVLTELNTFLSFRIAQDFFVPLSISDTETLLNRIKIERHREFPARQERAFDIKRYNLFDEDNITVTHTFNGITASLRPNSLNWALPIAPRYIQQNPEIIQNPRE